MSMNTTPKGERIHIALFGRRNAGKSSLINAITGQDLAIVSDVLGTTTDPVYKAMEILPLGPVMLIDTPGLDDEGVLGEERIKKARSVLNKTDLALIVADGNEAAKDFSFEHQILALTKKKNIPSIVVLNKQDLWAENEAAIQAYGDLCVSSKTGYHIHELKELMTTKLPRAYAKTTCFRLKPELRQVQAVCLWHIIRSMHLTVKTPRHFRRQFTICLEMSAVLTVL